ncbi:phosphatase PAP2 family protein [Actinomarinicola tropica]|uniref:Inositolphosphotransferase Aur1/Ipt1 domain-containing protein n=1 Tax=Actinomarinicola tropica TaxID=2789776 RepID=A0A5Q2RQD6_9ACTN|nr:phosphatase PAP2 family protein [Actinomarinicola tropica]QGG96110.1 hypothetical protein GH723_13940 [Actinomarinicola tropica]
MTVDSADEPVAGVESGPTQEEGRVEHASRLRCWREVVYIAVFYAIYTYIRNQFGSASVDSSVAHDNALTVIRIEEALGLFHEETIQELFLDWRPFIQFWNVFYGTFHFAVTIGVLVWLFFRWRDQYPAWRNTLAFTTGLALLGFTLFPLMPPRLLSADDEFGAGHNNPYFIDDYGFVDTLAEYGGLWSFNEGAMAKVSNQYAAMPSLHFAWATWCALAIAGRTRQWWAKVLAGAYPPATLFAIVVTGNHFWLDAVGGAIVLAVGWMLGSRLAAWNDRRLAAVSHGAEGGTV